VSSSPSAGERAVRILVRGHVQGVGFRYFTRDTARRLGLRGWVRNLRDGRTVEVQAAGPAEAVEKLVHELRVGPPGAIVTDVDVSEPDPFPELPAAFEIRPTA
jgi:acylphosphatase